MTDFYQSPADKLRFEILLKSLREGSLNLAIVGDDEVALANYGRQIYDHLIDAGEENVEWWSSADSEKLVQRFNNILSELTVDEALDKSQKRSPKRYMIFPDTHAIQDFELQLLARLINGFPTSNINLVLVVNQLDPYEEKLAVFGKNLLQWILESETPPAARPPKRSSRIETLEDSSAAAPDAIADFSATFAATLASGKFPGPGEGRATSQGNGEPTFKDPNAFDPLMDAPGRGGPNAGSESEPGTESSKPGSFSSKLAATLIVAIVLTVSAFALIYKDEVAKEAQNLQDFVSGKRPATAKTTPTKAVETASPANSATPPSPGQPASAPTEGTASVTPGAATPAGTPASPASAVATANQTPPSPPTPTPTNASAPTNTPAQVPTPTPNSVGMSSSVKVPVKTDDSLIPNKEVVIANKPVTAPANNPVSPGATPSSNPTPASVVANAPANVIALKADPKTQVKPEVKVDAKTETKPDTKLDAKIDPKESKPVANKEPTKEVVKEVPRETPKEAPKETSKETTKSARDQREAKPVNKPAPVAKTNEPLPKLDTKADRAEKVEESKPKSATSESPSAFKPRAEDQKWVQSLPEDGWVMQHSALDSLEEARAFQQSSPFYRDAKVMYTKRKDSPPYYIVVTGPYPSRQDAEAETRKHPIMSKAWVRSARSLKNQFED